MLDGRRTEAGQDVASGVHRRRLALVLAACVTVLGTLVLPAVAGAQPGDPDPEPTSSTTSTSAAPPPAPTTTPTTVAPPTTPPPVVTVPPPVEEETPAPTRPDPDEDETEDEDEDEEEAAVEVVEAETATFVTVANLLVPGNGLDGAQATTTTTAPPASAGSADDESRMIWMIIAALAGVGLLVALLTWRYWLLTRPGLDLDDDE
ncbi:MAG: hypothetical protein PV358_07145, partial [Acidimicrobiales bacterium]|nr:hypothetical protein [Acidimicrobiales bacterium]